MAAGGPIFQPVCPVYLILVIQVCEAFGQLIAFAQVTVIREEALQRLEMRLVDQLRQQAHEPPCQRCLVEQRGLRDFILAQHAAIELPHEAARQLHVDGGGNPAAAQVIVLRVFRQGEFQPLSDAVALHQGDFVFQRRERITPHPADHQAAQFIEAVAVNHHETWGKGRFGRHG